MTFPSRLVSLVLAAALPGMAAACFHFEDTFLAPDGGGGDSIDGGLDTDGAVTSLSVTAPPLVRVLEDGTADMVVTIARNGITGPVMISVSSGLPAGVTVPSAEIPDGQSSATLGVTAGVGATLGAADITVEASAGATIASAVSTLLVAGAPGTLDPSFNLSGVLTSADADEVVDIAVAASGRIYVAVLDGGVSKVFALDQDGAFDIAFAGSGMITLSGYSIKGLWVREGGGVMTVGNAGSQLGVKVFTANGSLDAGFEGGGEFGPTPVQASATGEAMAVASNGSIYVAGRSTDAGSATVFSFSATGEYGSREMVPTDPGAGDFLSLNFIDIGLQSDGSIVVVGPNNGFPSPRVMRLTPGFAIDTTFGNDGDGTELFGTSVIYPSALFIGGADEIALSGRHDSGALSIGLLSADGKTRVFQTQRAANGNAHDIAIDSSSRVISAGEFCFESCMWNTGVMYRFAGDGMQDNTFATLGTYEFQGGMGNPQYALKAIAMQPDGRLVVGGRRNSDWMLARLWD